MTKSQRILFTEDELIHLKAIIALTKHRIHDPESILSHLAIEYKTNRALQIIKK